MSKKIIRDELDKLEHEFKDLVKDGFTMDDDFMVDLLDRIETKRITRKAENEAKRVIAPPPPYLKDVIWYNDPKQKTPHIGGRGITKRDFAMFGGAQGEVVYQQIMANIRWKMSPIEPWRVISIHVMAWELSESRQKFPTPNWLDLQSYAPRRFRTTTEALEDHLSGADDGLTVEEEPVKAPRKKKPTKKDLLDAKYAQLMKML